MTRPPLLPHERWLRLGIIAMLALLAAFPLLKKTALPLPSIPCGFKSMTGLPCAFCGATRSVAALLAGDPARAIHLNALALPAVAALLAAAAICLAEFLRGRAFADWHTLSRRVGRFLPLTLLLLLAWWIPHIVSALKSPKHELVELQNPIAARLQSWLAGRQR